MTCGWWPRHWSEQEYFSGDHVFEINEQGDYLYLLVSGKIGISIEQDPSSTNYIPHWAPVTVSGK